MLPPRVAATLADRGYNQSFADLGVAPDPDGAGVLGALSRATQSRPAQKRPPLHAAMEPLRNRAQKSLTDLLLRLKLFELWL